MSDCESETNPENDPLAELIRRVDNEAAHRASSRAKNTENNFESTSDFTPMLVELLDNCFQQISDKPDEFVNGAIIEINRIYWDVDVDVDVLRAIDNSRGRSPVDMAVQSGEEKLYEKVINVGIVKYALQGKVAKLKDLFDFVTDYGQSVRIETDGLCLALKKYHQSHKSNQFAEIIELFLENHASNVLQIDVNTPITCEDVGNVPLYYSLRYGDDDFTAKLLGIGARLDVQTKNGIRPIDAVRVETLKTFLDALVRFDESDFNSQKVSLHCQSIDNTFVKCLIQNRHFNGLILHPVIAAIIHLKWTRFRNIRFLGIIWKIIYLFALVMSVQNYNRECVYGSASVGILFIIISSIWDENYRFDQPSLIAFIPTLIFIGMIFWLAQSIYGLIGILLFPVLLILGNYFDMLKILIPVCYITCEIMLILELNVQYGAFVCLVLAGFDTFNILFHFLPCTNHVEIFKIVARECCNFLIFFLPLLGFFSLALEVIDGKGTGYQIAFGKLLDLLFINSFESDNLLRTWLLLLVGVIGTNIMTGLAVYDINDIKGNAETLVYLKRAERILKIEENFVFKRFFETILDANHERDRIGLEEEKLLKFQGANVGNKTNAISKLLQKFFEPNKLSENSLRMINDIFQERCDRVYNFTRFVLKIESVEESESAEILRLPTIPV